jgi:anthranilate synthase component 2
MILIVDNYDSFTYNLVQLVALDTADYRVVRNDKITVEEAAALAPDGILISPGPGRPESAGICVDLIRRLGSRTPILGVCLGHQAIGYAFGGRIIHAPVLMHGKTSAVHHDGRGLFAQIPSPMEATRYHSLVVDPAAVPDELLVTATTEDGTIMALRHREWAIDGIQFHPESVLTSQGPRLIRNWLASLGRKP